ncbi:hypothetical protein ATI53_106718, partial [Salipiger aestuarii]
TDRLFGAATGAHEFDKLCAALDTDHRLTPPKPPQTDGMIPFYGLKPNYCGARERFSGRIEEGLQSHPLRSGKELETTLLRYALASYQQLPQSALSSKTPLQAMKDRHELKPELINKQPYCLPGCDSYLHSRGELGHRVGAALRATGSSDGHSRF